MARSIISNFFESQDVQIWKAAAGLTISKYPPAYFDGPIIEISDQKDPQSILTIAGLFGLGDGDVVNFHNNYWTRTDGSWNIFQPQQG